MVLIKFTAPAGLAFKKGKLVAINAQDPEQRDRLWTKVVSVAGDGTNAGRGVLTNGLGAVTFSDAVPTGAVANRIVPRFINDLESISQIIEVSLKLCN